MPKNPYSTKNKAEQEMLFNLYITRGWSADRIAAKLNIATRTVFSLLKLHGISRDKIIEEPDYCPTCGHIVDKVKKKRKPKAK